MLLNLQTLVLHSRDDQDSDDEMDDDELEEDDEDWRTVVDRDIFVDGVRVGWIKSVVVRREEMAGCKCDESDSDQEKGAKTCPASAGSDMVSSDANESSR
jgi:hypothetical protein